MAKILILEDNMDLLEFICILLERNKLEVQGCSSSNEMKLILESFDPDLLIIDVIIKNKDGTDEDGRDLCKEFKKKNKNIPVILTSANPKVLINYEVCGADDTLEKPFNMQDILNKINKYIQKPL
jgi:DNA-binding response OmpR family regulator